MTPEQADREKHKVRLTWQDTATAPDLFDTLPERLRELVGASLRLPTRILHLDTLVAARIEPNAGIAGSPVGIQHDLLQSAFGRRAGPQCGVQPVSTGSNPPRSAT
jgi:regulator of CtrA degradation